MDKSLTLSKIAELGLLAVLRSPSHEAALATVQALCDGGIVGIEITYSTPNAPDVVRTLRERFGEKLLVGMGTLTEVRHAQEAAEAGAQFLVSPHHEAGLAAAMVATGLPVMMGALTPTEVLAAWRMGSDVVKLFPGSLGGPSYLKALRGPFPYIPLMPTGGVSRSNAGDWFKAGAFAVGAGSELCPRELVAEGRWSEITDIAREYRESIAAARRTLQRQEAS